MNQPDPNPYRVISSGASKRDIFLAVLGGILLIALVGFAIVKMGNTSVGTAITGKVVEKRFVPRAETQVTIGAGAVQRTDKAGLYYLDVKANDKGATYHVMVNREDYDRVQVGDSYEIPKASLVP